MKGWECPKCGACYAPTVSQCFNCVGTTVQPVVTPTILPPTPGTYPPNRTAPFPWPVTPWYPRWPGDGPTWHPTPLTTTCTTGRLTQPSVIN